jgi:peptidoglycan hydrolase-like protein with peptidoglycan-binding domain
MAADRSDTVRKTQQALKDKGYYAGHVDGIMGPQTRAALRKYQTEKHLAGAGQLTRETAEHLGAVQSGDTSVGEHFENAGDKIADHYSAAGKSVASGTMAWSAK